MNKLFKSVLNVRQQISNITKDATSPLNKYASLHNIMQELQPLLNENNLVIYHEFKKTEDGILNVITNLVYVDDDDMHTLKVEFPVKEVQDSQTMGKAMTYARRYNITALFNLTFIDDKDDNDYGDTKAKTTKVAPKPLSF
ncbi:MAG: ERF family protein [Alphaproteobacteria bacterium]|nr:ERF family protein [Alphaproteobacteria bacterium]